MKEYLQDLIKTYETKIHYLSEMLKEKRSEQDVERLKAKRSTYRCVITDLQNIIELQNN